MMIIAAFFSPSNGKDDKSALFPEGFGSLNKRLIGMLHFPKDMSRKLEA